MSRIIDVDMMLAGAPGEGVGPAELAELQRHAAAVPVVSADWYSDAASAIAAAGPGGTVVWSDGVTYTYAAPVMPLDGQTLEGGDRLTTQIITAGEAAIKSPTPTTAQLQDVRIRNLNLWGNDAGGVGLDARGMTRCRFDDLRVEGFVQHAVWWGGDQPTDIGGWSNMAYNIRARAPLNGGAAMYFGGRVGASGPATANNIIVIGGSLYTRAHAASFGADIVHGSGNMLIGVDIGYGVDSGAAVRLGHDLARQNVFKVRTENIKRAVLIEGGKYNRFETCQFGLSPNAAFHGAEIFAGSLRNAFLLNWWGAGGLGPKVWEDAGPGAYETIINDLAPDYGSLYSNVATDPRGVMHVVAATGSVAMGAKVQGEARERFFVAGDGSLRWRNPADGTSVTTFSVENATEKILGWSNETKFKVPRVALPPASATYRGVIARTEGGAGSADALRICLKNADDTYSWKVVSIT